MTPILFYSINPVIQCVLQTFLGTVLIILFVVAACVATSFCLLFYRYILGGIHILSSLVLVLTFCCIRLYILLFLWVRFLGCLYFVRALYPCSVVLLLQITLLILPFLLTILSQVSVGSTKQVMEYTPGDHYLGTGSDGVYSIVYCIHSFLQVFGGILDACCLTVCVLCCTVMIPMVQSLHTHCHSCGTHLGTCLIHSFVITLSTLELFPGTVRNLLLHLPVHACR